MKWNQMQLKKAIFLQAAGAVVVIAVVGVLGFAVFNSKPARAACDSSQLDLGYITSNISVPSDGTYRVWSRIMAPSISNNSYQLVVDNTGCYTVGDSATIPSNTWTWVNYQNGDTAATLDVSLSAGIHSFKLMGREAGVKVDRVMVVSDAACLPTGTGDNCQGPVDPNAPTVSLNAPGDGAVLSGLVNLAATAADNVGVTKVEFYVDNQFLFPATTAAPYTYELDTTRITPGQHNLFAKAYDAAGNVATSAAVAVTVSQSAGPGTTLDTTPPTVSVTSPAAGATVSGTISATAQASDDVGVSKVNFSVDGVVKLAVIASPYAYSLDTTGLSNGAHSLSAMAFDAAGNTTSDTVSIVVQNSDSQAPSIPSNPKATAAAYNKVNITWTASTDNIGVTGYYVVRNGVTIVLLGSVTSYSDVVVSPSTAYSYQVMARDAAGNVSALSAKSMITTPAAPDAKAPTAPTGLSATVVNTTQVNLAWKASTDNIGVTGYDVYRTIGSSAATKIATVSTLSYGNTNLTASTTYKYYVVARDAAGNVSTASSQVSATTAAAVATGTIKGQVTGKGGAALKNAVISLVFGGTTHTYATGTTGNYTITGVPAGTYAVTFAYPNYVTKKVNTTVTGGATSTLNTKMAPK
jgi:chitodextrinase